ncbi:hypothetical protein ASE76_16180 [Xylophilus sp. Leaf220]|nr:hypothetical protein ASE76_16180 [Xylophilus sp. Leaf220]
MFNCFRIARLVPSFSSFDGCLGRVLILSFRYSLQWFVPFSTRTPCDSSHRLNSLIFTYLPVVAISEL